MPKALQYTEQRATEAGVKVTLVEADITEWDTPHSFDLVIDHGLLHNVDPERHSAYRERVLKTLADDSDFVLLHWHPRYPGQVNGKMGPRRVSREDIQAFYAPDLRAFFARRSSRTCPNGGRQHESRLYWFRRTRSTAPRNSWANPTRPWQARRRVEKMIGDYGNRLAAPEAREIRARSWGRRLGTATPSEARGSPAILHAGRRQPGSTPPGGNVRIFAAEAGGLCTTNPRCGESEVNYANALESVTYAPTPEDTVSHQCDVR